jgi:hypothetical protein
MRFSPLAPRGLPLKNETTRLHRRPGSNGSHKCAILRELGYCANSILAIVYFEELTLG